MQFTYKAKDKTWFVKLYGNTLIYSPENNQEETSTLVNAGGDQSLVGGFADTVDLGSEEKAKLLEEALGKIRDALASNDVSQEEKSLLGFEQSRIEKFLSEGSKA